MSTESLNIRITAELAQFRAALQSIQGQLEQTRKSGEKIGGASASGIATLNQRLGASARIVAGLAASLGAGLSIAGLIRASDEASNIAAKLKLATGSAQGFAVAQKAVFEIAQRTRTSLLATVDLYARIERSTRGIGINQATQLKLTETINQAAKISGGGAGAEAALFQLSQGLASGTLRGEELNSVLEQTPRLAQAIADGMDVPVGKLRKLAEQGQLTSEAVLRALLSQSAEIQREFAEFPPTIADGFTQIRNSFVQYLTTSEDAASSAATLARALKSIADNIPTLINAFIRLAPVAAAAWLAMKGGAAAPAIIAFFTALPGLITATSTSFTLVGMKGTGALGAIKGGLGLLIAAFAGWQIGKLLSEEFLEVRLAGIAMVNGLLKYAELIKGYYRVTAAVLQAAFITAFNAVLRAGAGLYDKLAAGASNIPIIGDKIAAAYSAAGDKLRGAQLQADNVGEAFTKAAKKTTDALAEIERTTGALADAEIDKAYAVANPDAPSKDGVPPAASPAGKASKESAALAATNAQLVADAVKRALDQLQQLYDAGKISIKDYFAEKQRLELEGIDAAIEAAQAERGVAKGTAEVAAANAKLIILYRDRKQVGLDAAKAQEKAEEELTDKLGALRIRMLRAQGETGKATRLELQAEFQDLIAYMLENGKPAGAALARALIDTETFAAQLQDVQRKISEAVSSFQDTETSTGAQVQAGMLGQDDAETRVNEQRQASLAILVAQRTELENIRNAALAADDSLTFKKASESLNQVNGQIAQMSINTQSLGYKATQVLQGALTQLFEDLASGTKSAGDSLRDFVLNFVRGMAQIAANAMATYIVLQLLDAIYPGLGKTTAAMMGATSSHSGGMAGGSGTRRQLPALMFAGAPRMHTGGIAGLGPNEIPAVLEKGEEVLTKNDRRHRNNGGLEGQAASGEQKKPLIVFGEKGLADALAGPDGEAMVVYHMRNNRALLSTD